MYHGIEFLIGGTYHSVPYIAKTKFTVGYISKKSQRVKTF